jgi:inner membrane protein
MTSRTHDMVAFGSLLTVAVLFPPSALTVVTTITSLIGSVVGSLIPDMDQATNRLWDLLPAGNVVGKILKHLMIGHRTISHSILGIYILYMLLSAVFPMIFNPKYIDIQILTISVMIGFVSHICADMLTKEGVPLLFPFPWQIGIPPVKALRITTGKFIENVIIYPGVLIYIMWLIVTYRNTFVSLAKLIRY